MSNVSFEEEQQFTSPPSAQKPTPTIIAWVMKLGLAKTEQAANGVLLVVALIAVALAVYFFMSGSPKPSPTSVIPTGAVGAPAPAPALRR
ncbi:MAG: hypothetical protein Q7R88_00630 [bacterium]|nr:hypothetical protein [bacterium]